MISILLATTGRPDMAERCVRGLLETTVGHDIEICVEVDSDAETEKRLRRILRGHDKLRNHDGYRGCAKAWNDALRASSGDPVVLAADDLTWGQGWLTAALERLRTFPDNWGLVGFNDGHWNADLSTHYLMSRRFVVEVLGGVVAWECYRHSFTDVETNERAKRARRYAWCEDAHVLHSHWTYGERSQDETDSRNFAEYAESQRIFQEREAAGFPTDYKAVIK